MCEGLGARLDEEVEDHLWNDFESCAQSVTLLYRNPTWKALQKAAASTTQLYKSGLEREKKSFDRGYMAGRQSVAREILGLRRNRELSVEEIWKLLSKPLCPTDHSRPSPGPPPEPSDSHAVDVFQQVLSKFRYMAGRQSVAREILGLRRNRELSVEEIWKLLSKPLCPTDHSRPSPGPPPEPSDSHAVDVFQQALCVPSNAVSPQRVNELNSFLSGQLNRHRKRVHSPSSGPFKKLRRSQ
ncbi:UPF0472 protein C16orf72 -like protein [Toxocara canis]|uniref:UPF0472 protein C16orf72-like protein n=1 Tax=Toxocara canis TaxID=6265 RepID=A0A0B2UXZ1_TOXCA|nr:UPF0472 protein C16orf72 -like protein [Toxocara canis]